MLHLVQNHPTFAPADLFTASHRFYIQLGLGITGKQPEKKQDKPNIRTSEKQTKRQTPESNTRDHSREYVKAHPRPLNMINAIFGFTRMSQGKEEEQEGLTASSSEHMPRSRTSFIFQPLLYHYQISLKYVFLGFDIFQQIISTHCPGDLSWESKSGREWPRVLRSANQAFTSSTSPSWNGKNMEMSRSTSL